MANRENFEKITDSWIQSDNLNTEKLFFIENCGCDDNTYGLIRMDYHDFLKFAKFVENLNSGSTYSCQPRIYYYETSIDYFEKVSEADNERIVEETLRIMTLDDERYIFKPDFDRYNVDIHADMRTYKLPKVLPF